MRFFEELADAFMALADALDDDRRHEVVEVNRNEPLTREFRITRVDPITGSRTYAEVSFGDGGES